MRDITGDSSQKFLVLPYARRQNQESKPWEMPICRSVLKLVFASLFIPPSLKLFELVSKQCYGFNKYLLLCSFLPQGLCTFVLFACNVFPSEICMAHSLLQPLVKCHLFRQDFVTNHHHSLILYPDLFSPLYLPLLNNTILYIYLFVCLIVCLPDQNISSLTARALLFYFLLYSKLYIEHLTWEAGHCCLE